MHAFLEQGEPRINVQRPERRREGRIGAQTVNFARWTVNLEGPLFWRGRQAKRSRSRADGRPGTQLVGNRTGARSNCHSGLSILYYQDNRLPSSRLQTICLCAVQLLYLAAVNKLYKIRYYIISAQLVSMIGKLTKCCTAHRRLEQNIE